jgi:hypothetical protein
LALVLSIVMGVWYGRRPGSRPFPAARVGLGLALTLAFTALANESRGGSRLEPVRVSRVRGEADVAGSYLTQGAEAVYVARKGTIIGIPNASVRLVRIARAPGTPPLPRSLVGSEVHKYLNVEIGPR